MRTILILIAVFASGVAHAQDRLSLSADTIFYPLESGVYALNETGSAVILDSISVRFTAPREWSFEIVGGDTSLVLHGLSPAYDSTGSVNLRVEPSDSVALRAISFDPCIICKKRYDAYPRDTLLVYSGGVAQPDTILLDATNYVSVERNERNAEALQVRVFPNPASGSIEIASESGEPWTARLYDLRGREMLRVEHDHGGPRALNVSWLAPGVYVLTVRLAGSRIESQRLVIAR